jgi:hypothetical protein
MDIAPSYNDYIGPRFVLFGAPAVYATDERTWDENAQRALWNISVQKTGVDFGGI